MFDADRKMSTKPCSQASVALNKLLKEHSEKSYNYKLVLYDIICIICANDKKL